MRKKSYLAVGIVLATWGVRGQIKIKPLTDNPKRFKTLNEIFFNLGDKSVFYKVESVMFLKHFFPVLKLVGVNSKQEAEVFKGHYINIKRKHAVKLPKGHYFICDIVGLRVFDEHNHYIGIITDLLETGANDVYVVKTKDKGDVLIPAIKQVVKKIDLAKGVMVIKPQEGML